jgi:type III restriction enzyme
MAFRGPLGGYPRAPAACRRCTYRKVSSENCGGRRITAAITATFAGAADRDGAGSCNPVGSYPLRPLQPSRPYRLQTDRARCHVNWVVLDRDSEAEFCRVAEAHPI